MDIAEKVALFHQRLDVNLCYIVGRNTAGCMEATYFCDEGPHQEATGTSVTTGDVGFTHSMLFARLSAEEASLPPEVWKVAETKFKCSCGIFFQFEAFVREVIETFVQDGALEDVENLRELLEEVEELADSGVGPGGCTVYRGEATIRRPSHGLQIVPKAELPGV